MSNVFSNAVVIGADRDPEKYHQQEGIKNSTGNGFAYPKRGSKEYRMSRSDLMEFARCPHRWVCGYSRKDSGATDWGSLMDRLLLDPLGIDKIAVKPAQYPATPKKKGDPIEMKNWSGNSTWCSEWKAEKEREGFTVVSRAELDDCEAAIRNIREDESIAKLLSGASHQVEVRADYVDRETGVVVPVKCLIDVVPSRDGAFSGCLSDFKTARNGALGSWARFVHGFGYHIQAGMYLDLWEAANPEDRREEWRIFGCESERPYEPFKRFLSLEFIGLGRIAYQNALRRYARCLASNAWPGYDSNAPAPYQGFSLTEPEPWMMTPENVFEELPELPDEPTDNQNDQGITP